MGHLFGMPKPREYFLAGVVKVLSLRSKVSARALASDLAGKPVHGELLQNHRIAYLMEGWGGTVGGSLPGAGVVSAQS